MAERAEPPSQRRTLTVSGRGTASADPDHIVLSFGVVGRDPSYSSSVEELNGRVEARVAASASEAAVTISFDVSDTESLRRRAMRAAVADAREGARVLAEASGAALGQIQRIEYSYVEVRTRCLSYEFADAGAVYEAAASAPDVEPEALDAEEGVTVVWEIS